MNIRDIRTCDLKPYENNPRLNEDAVDLVAASIDEFGFKQPIVVDKDLIIIAGHTRWKAAQKLGLETVPCIQADDLTPAQVKAYRLADNKVAEAAQWDLDALQFELEELDNMDFDMEPFGFETETFDEQIAEDDNFEPEIPEEPTTKRGQCWMLGRHRLMVGDSTKRQDVEKLCSDATIDLVVTDPPYNVALGQHMRPSEAKQLHRRTDGLVIDNDSWEDDEGFIEFLKVAFENMTEQLKPGGAFYIWYAATQSKNFQEAAERAGLNIRQFLIWNKNTFALGRQDYQWKHEPCLYGWKDGAAHYFVNTRNLVTVLEDTENLDIDHMKKDELKDLLKSILGGCKDTTILDEKKPTKSDLHPTMKPIPLIARQIKNSSRTGENVLDLFGGSGSTLMACEQLGRRCFMMEYDPHYADVIIKRWEDYTGEQAELISDAC